MSAGVRPHDPHPALHALPVLTPSLILRQFSVEDASAVLALNAEPSTKRWLPSHAYGNFAEAREAMEFLVSCYTEPGHPRRGPYVLAVAHKESAALLGHVGFSPLDEEVEVSYAIAESQRGQGLGAEALDHACTWVALHFKLQHVIAVTSVENAASRRLLEKAKFRFQIGESMRFQGAEQRVVRYTRELVPHSVAQPRSTGPATAGAVNPAWGRPQLFRSPMAASKAL